MSTTIDNRVVKMTFDNAQFEKGIKETIKSITDFESKLNFKGATAGFDKIKEAANKLNFANLDKKAKDASDNINKLGKSAEDSFTNISKSADKVDLSKIGDNAADSFRKLSESANNVDMSGIPSNAQKAMTEAQLSVDSLSMDSITDKTSEAAEGFNAFSIVAVGALLEVGRQINDFVTGGLYSLLNGIKSLADKALFQPIKDGFQEYQTQIGSIQTIMANTSRDFHSAQDIADVNGALDELNQYADKTIYNFTEMTRNIGTFTAAGVSMEDAVPAIQGIANLAALSGSNSEQASRAMYQLSQAMAAGTVKLMDWNSVVNAGMGGKVFQTKLLETAKHIHNINVGFEDNATVMDAVISGNKSFRDSLEDGWITTDVLTEALIQMTYAENDMTAAEKASAIAHLESLGYTSEEIDAVFKLGQTAMESATKVRTWTQLWDTVGEALGSGWAQTWRTIVGDFQEATNLFTYLSQVITGVIGTIDNARNAIVEGWANFGGRDILFGTFTEDHLGRVVTVTNGVLQNLVDAITGWAKPVADAFSDVFQIFGDNGPDPSTYDADYVKALKNGAEDAEKYRQEYLEPFIEHFGENSQEVADQVNNLNHTLDMFNNHAFDDVLDPTEYDANYARALKKGAEEAEQYRKEYLEPFIEQFGEDSQEVADQVAFLDHTADLYNEHKFDNIDPETLLLDDVALQFTDLTDHIRAFTATLVPTDNAMEGLRGIFEGLFAAIKTVISIVGTLIDIFSSAIEIVRIFTDPLVDLVLYIGGSVFRVFGQLCDYINEVVHAFRDFFHSVVDRVKPAIKGVVDGFLAWADIPGKLRIFFNFIQDFLEAIWQMVNIPEKIRLAKDAFSGVFDTIKNFLFGTKESAEGAGDAIEGLVPKVSNYFGRIKESIYEAFPAIKDFIDKIKHFYSVMRGDDPNETSGTYIQRMVDNLKNSIKEIWQPIKNLMDALGIFGGKVVEFVENLQPVKDAIETFKGLKNSVGDFINSIPDRIKSFGPQVKGEAEEAASGFDAFKKIQEITDYFSNVTVDQFITDAQRFKDEFVGHITGAFEAIKNLNVKDLGQALYDSVWNLEEKLSYLSFNIKEKLIKIFPDAEETINTSWQSLTSAFGVIASNVSLVIWNAFNNTETIPEFIGYIFVEIYKAVLNGFRNIIDYVQNIDFGTMVATAVSKISGIQVSFVDFGNNVADALKSTLPAAADQIDKAWGTIDSVTSRGFVNLQNAIANAKDESSTFPEFMINVFRNVSDVVNDFIGEIAKAISEIKISDVLGVIIKPLESLRDFLKDNFPDLSKLVDVFITSLSNFRDHLSETGQTIGGVAIEGFKNLLSILESIAPKAMGLLEELGKAFTGLPDGIVKGLKWASAALSHLPGFLGTIFGGISKMLTGYTVATKAEAAEMPEVYGQMFEGAQTEPQEASDALTQFFNMFDPTNVGESLKNMAGFVIEKLKEQFGKIKEYLDTLPDKMNGVLDELGNPNGRFAGIIKNLEEIIKGLVLYKFAGFITTMGKSLSTFLANLGQSMKNYTEFLKKKETLDFSEKMKNIAEAIGIIGTVVAVLSQINVEDLKKAGFAVGQIGIFLIAMEAIPAALEKLAKFDMSGGATSILKTAIGLLAIGIAMHVLREAFIKMAEADIQKIAEGFLELTGIIVGLLIVMKKLGGPETLSAGIGLLALAAAMWIMVPALKGLSDVFLENGVFSVEKLKSVATGLGLIAVVVGLFAFMAKLTNGVDLVASATAIMALAGAIVIMSIGLGLLASINSDTVATAATAIGAIMLVFLALTALTEVGDLMPTALALLAFGAAVGVMAFGLGMLANLNNDGIIKAAAAIGGLIFMFGALVVVAGKMEKVNLLATAGSLIIFGVAVASMSIGLMMLAQCDWVSVLAGAGAIGVLLLALGAMVALTKEADLAVTSLSLIVFGAAVAVMAWGLSQFANLPIDNILWGAGAIAVLIAVLAGAAALLSAPVISELAVVILPLLALAFIAVGGAAYLIANGISIVVDAFLRMAEAAPVIETFVQTIANNLGNFLAAAGAFAAIGAGMVALALGMGVLGLALGAFGLACSFAAGGIGLLNIALNGFLDVAARAQEFSEAGSNITAGIGQGISSGVGWVVQAIIGIGQTILSTILGFFGIHSPSDLMAEQVGQFIPAGIAEGIDMNSGSMMDSLGTGLEGLLGKFSTWVETDGLPKLQEFGNGLLDKLKNEILPQISDWVQTQGIPMLKNLAGQAVQGLFEEANKLPPKLLEMATGIPANVWEGIHQGWNDFIKAGAEIVNGIVEGIKSVPNAIGNAIKDLSNKAYNGITNFFQIESPSKLMKEKVGKYIPLGLAAGISKYSEMAVNSAIAMAEDTSNGINDNLTLDAFNNMQTPTIPAPVIEPLDDFDELYDLPDPHIRPVLDIDSTWDDFHSYMDSFDGTTLSTTQTNLQNISANLDLSSLGSSLMDQNKRLSELASQNEKLVNEVNHLRSDMAAYADAINNSAIVMDSGALVGSITTKMDKALGRRQSRASRGVF